MTSNMSTPGKNNHLIKSTAAGFSLIELMVALAVASIVMAAIYSVYASLTRSYTTQNVAADVQQTVRAGMDYMVEDIMMAGLDPTEDADAEIVNASGTQFCFTLDRNMNGEIENVDSERMTYRHNAQRLEVCIDREPANCNAYNPADPNNPANWQLFIDNVTNLNFVYLDADGVDLGDPVNNDDLRDIRTVIISMTVEEPAGRDGVLNRTYSTRVRCRNPGL